MLKVLAFTDVVSPEGSGGVERQILEIYPRLIAAGKAEVRLVSLSDRRSEGVTNSQGLRIRRVRRTSLVGITGAQVAFSLPLWRAAWQEYRDFQPDVIHANTLFYATSLGAAWIACRTSTPMVVTAHIGEVDALSQPYRTLTTVYEQTVGRALLRKATRIICIGDSVQHHMRARGAAPSKLRVVPNGVDSAKFRPPDPHRGSRSRPVVASVGRLIFNKGNQYLIEAARELLDRGYDFELWLVGDGPMEAKLRTMGAPLLASGHLRLLGRRDDIPDVLAHADIFVRASLTESMPMGVLEAMACGLPVIASDVGSTAEIITDGLTGLLVSPRSVEQLVRTVASLLDNDELRQTLGEAARERAQQLDWEMVAEMTGGVLCEAAEHG